MKFNENLRKFNENLRKFNEKSKKKRKNPLKQVQFSPIWTKLCQNFANMIIKKKSKPEGHHYPNKGVNEDFFPKIF